MNSKQLQKQKLWNIRELSASREILAMRVPLIYRLNIWFILLLVICAMVWIVVGSRETVIRADGLIRPFTNISSVRSWVPGQIKGIYFKAGTYTLAGDLLLEIDDEAILKKKVAYTAQLDRINRKIQGLEYIRTSLYEGNNRVPPSYGEASSRFEAYWTERQSLKASYDLASLLWEEENNLLPNATSKAMVREYENKMRLAGLAVDKWEAGFAYDIEREMDSYNVELLNIQSSLTQVEEELSKSQIKAPVSGIIQEVSSLNTGDYIGTGQDILRIVPQENEQFEVELYVSSSQAGKVEEGMDVKIRFPSFPFHEFGQIMGVVTEISPDIITDQRGGSVFKIISSLEAMTIQDRKGRSYPLKVGLQAEAKMIVDKETILFYLLDKLDFR